METIADNLARVRERIAAAALKSGRAADSVRLVAVSKTFPAEMVAEAYRAGQRVFGENRVQELSEKTPHLPMDCEWHLIGHLQQNKVRPALAHAAWIHSVDTAALLERVFRLANETGAKPSVLLEVNISGEDSKFGLKPEDVEPLLALQMETGATLCRGLMTVAPADASEAELHRVFAGLRELRDRLETRLGLVLPELSMGMSGDFEIAIAEGATMVRVGSAIFGHRTYELPVG